jgi:hypothetical protein
LDYGRNQRWRQLIFYKQGANFASILEKKVTAQPVGAMTSIHPMLSRY